MSDLLKAQKLAAARKRLKEYQKTQSDKRVIKNDENTENTRKNPILQSNDELSIPVAETTEDFFETKYFNIALFENDKLNTNYFDKNVSDHSKSTSNQIECEPNSNSPNSALEMFSNTESLRQISNQLNSLLDHEIPQNYSENSLETRNQELNSLLKCEKLKNEELNLQMQEYISRISHLESEISLIKSESDEKVNREMMSLQEQLKNYVETVGILVGEKNELTRTLNQSQTTAVQKTIESEELQGRLKASRHRVAELEKELNYLKSFKDNVDKNKQENTRELEKLKLEFNLLNEQLQNNTDELLELREKLTSKTNENLVLQQELQNKNSQLSLTELKLKQLSDGENFEVEKNTFQHQITELTQKITDLNNEKSQVNQKYIQYVQQLNTQINNLSESLEQKNVELENYSAREQSLIKHISELERNLQKSEPVINFVAQKTLEETIENLLKEKNDLEIKCEQEKSEFETKIEHQLLEIQQKNEKIAQLENDKEQPEQPDVKKLLATMESDKIAASRAVEQNKKLKQQLDELQQGFIEMSNNKLELTEKLQSEQFKLKETTETNARQSSTIEHLHRVISTKDKELMDLHQTIANLQKQNYLQTQQLDRLGHYEAQDNVSAILQQEICELKLNIEQLTLENNNLSLRVAGEDDNVNNCSVKNKIDREKAMEQLEERFKKTMADVANLTEEKQRLEHLVLQLQSETETIGEYITLYQCQRAILKEKSLEKDEQLKKLSKDKHEMKMKLEELNNLLQDLLPDEKKQEKVIINTDNNNDHSLQTAEKIISLLDEIQKSDLVQPTENSQNFHPCPLCSGQLITV